MSCALALALESAGNSIPARTAMMAMTTSSSMSVNPKAVCNPWFSFDFMVVFLPLTASQWFRVWYAVSFFRLDQSFLGGDFFKRGRLPQAHGPSARARQIVAVRRKSEARNRALVPVKRGRFLHGREIPQLNRAVVGAGGQRPAISRKGHTPDNAIVASQEPDISPVRLPKPDGAVPTGAGNPFPIRGESDALNPSFVSFEHGLWARAMRMPERHFSFLASDYECPAVW